MSNNYETQEYDYLAGSVANKVMKNLRQPFTDIKRQVIGIANTADRVGCIFLPEYTTKTRENYNFYDH